MIDIHSHILPGVDDGARDLEEALDMCRLCVKDGVEIIVATPHDLNGVYANNRNEIIEMTNTLALAARQQEIQLEILSGADVAMSPELPERIDQGKVMTVNDKGKYILLEPPAFFTIEALERQIFEIRRRGITPIITHPERNEVLMQHQDALYEAVLRGALIQVTAASITGGFGPQVQKRTMDLLARNIVHVIASDAHNTHSRKPGLSQAVELAAEIVGRQNAELIANDYPGAIVRGEDIDVSEPEPYRKRRGFLSMFFSRDRLR